jgi:hypothetical protein
MVLAVTCRACGARIFSPYLPHVTCPSERSFRCVLSTAVIPVRIAFPLGLLLVWVHCKKMGHPNALYWEWTWTFNRYPPLCTVLQTIFYMTIPQRKDLLGLCRSQTPPIDRSYQRQMLKCLYQRILVPDTPAKGFKNVSLSEMGYSEFVDMHVHLILNHLTASIVALGCRIAPGISESDYQDLVGSAISKEISAAITIQPSAEFNFESIFSSDPSHRYIPFTSRLSSNPLVAIDTHRRLQNVKDRLKNAYLFPTLGSKTVGSVISENFWTDYKSNNLVFKHNDGTENDGVTPTDCYRMYHQTGGYPGGPVELRVAWTYNQLEPRVYYARGGDVMMTSQYVQAIANILVDEFPETHRKNRFMPPTDPLLDGDVEVIYDYQSFTSCLETLVPFLDSLGTFMDDVDVNLVDMNRGVVRSSLGELIRRYNRECNVYASFDASKVLKRPPGEIVMQHTCGMLGVEGNIFFATLLHGLHLRFIAGLNRSKCVGDDARCHTRSEYGVLTTSEQDTLMWRLQGCAPINTDKIGKFEEGIDPDLQAFRYVKRPLRRSGEIMIEGILLSLPTVIYVTGPLDNYHTLHPSSAHPARKTYSQILRFVQELYVHSLKYHESDAWKAIMSHLMYLRRKCLELDPIGKYSAYKTSSHLTNYRFPPKDSWGAVDIDTWIIGDIGIDEMVRFPAMSDPRDGDSCDGRKYSVLVRRGSKARSFLTKLKYLDKIELFEEVSLRSAGPARFSQYLGGNYVPVNEYQIIEDIPAWLSFVPNVL